MKLIKALFGFRAIAVLMLMLGTGGVANAGNLWLTGHDADLHCAFGAQCNHFGIAVDFGRIGAPDPTLPVLFVTNNTSTSSDFVLAAAQAGAIARNSVEVGMPFPFDLIDPTDAAFATVDFSAYSAVVFASHISCGGCDMTSAGVDAINLREADLQSFFNDGGGLVYFAGADDRDDYYASVPIPATGVAVSPPFTLTAEGIAIGLLDPDDTNCCPTHNSFSLPGAGSPLVVAELDSSGFAETMFVGGGIIVDDVITDGDTTDGDTDGVSVPEPGTLTLLGLGLLGLVARRRRIVA